MICAKCHYWDVVPGLKLCEHCAHEPQPETSKQWKREVARLREQVDMLISERQQMQETIDTLSDLLRQVETELETMKEAVQP